MITTTADIVSNLRKDILRLQGFRAMNNSTLDSDLGIIKNAFPNASFPLGCIHEFVPAQQEDLAATNGFINGLLSSLLGTNGAVIWVSAKRRLFPPALKFFGLSPERFIFIDVAKEKDVLWVMDEALKCNVLTAVVGEIKDIDFKESRRFQLAAEQSGVTGFILRHNLRATINTIASVSRWKISSLQSEAWEDLPGIGSPQWHVVLEKVRNGKPHSWDIQWRERRFIPVHKALPTYTEKNQKAG